MPSAVKKTLPLPVAILLTLAVVISIREGSVWVCQMLGYPSAANIVGLITLFLLLMLWRFTRGLPEWLTPASNTLLVDSGFAFLPVRFCGSSASEHSQHLLLQPFDTAQARPA